MNKIPDRQNVQRLRWLMVGTILLDMVVTFMSQPAGYWQDTGLAFESNTLFHLILTRTFPWSFILYLIYALVAFVIVSILPRKAALIGIFSFIFCHFFRASCWLDYRWQFGMTTTFIYAFLIGEMILLFAFTASNREPVQIVKKLRWMMVGAMLFDMINTILGQPASYWHHPETANEGFSLSRFFIMQGWEIFLLYDLIFFSLFFFLVSSIPKRPALVLVIGLILSYYFGACTWINNGWHVSAEGPVLYGIVLSAIFVLLAFPARKEN